MTVSVGANATSYFGYAPQQCITKTVSITSGTAPFIYNWSLNRSLLSDVVNSSGDETMTGANTASVTVCLLDTATLCLTVTDANGCTASACVTINASDVRCFSGNSQKTSMCHDGTIMCVAQNRVDAHLAHGDNIGSCPTQRNNAGNVMMEMESNKSDFSIYPNPNAGDFIASIKLADVAAKGEMQIINASGQIVKRVSVYNQSNINISLGHSGMYLIKLILGNQVITKKVVIIK